MGYKDSLAVAPLDDTGVIVQNLTLISDSTFAGEVSNRSDSSKHKSKGQQALESRRAVEELLDQRKLLKEFDYFDDESLLEFS